MIRIPGFLLAFGAATFVMPISAHSAPAEDVVDAVAACRDIADPAARLACFDKAVTTLVAARERKDVVVLDRAEVQKTRRSLFGFTLPRIRLFGGGNDDGDNSEDIKEINGSIVGVAQIAADRWQVTLDDETRWITTESARGFPPRPGESIRIRRAPFGSYDASFNKRRTIKVRRIG